MKRNELLEGKQYEHLGTLIEHYTVEMQEGMEGVALLEKDGKEFVVEMVEGRLINNVYRSNPRETYQKIKKEYDQKFDRWYFRRE